MNLYVPHQRLAHRYLATMTPPPPPAAAPAAPADSAAAEPAAAEPPTKSALKKLEKEAKVAAMKALKAASKAVPGAAPVAKKDKAAPVAKVEEIEQPFIEVPEGHKKGERLSRGLSHALDKLASVCELPGAALELATFCRRRSGDARSDQQRGHRANAGFRALRRPVELHGGFVQPDGRRAVVVQLVEGVLVLRPRGAVQDADRVQLLRPGPERRPA